MPPTTVATRARTASPSGAAPVRRLDDSRILITGASRGLGRALAEVFAAEGGRLALTATRETNLEEVAEATSAVATITLDLESPDSVTRAAAAAVEALGEIDVVVNNAGLLGVRADLAEYPMEVWRRVMSVTVDGTLQLTQALLPHIVEGGAIINVTSGAAGRRGWGAYGLSRLALNGMTRMFRDELAERGIRCVAINPGGVRSDMRAAAYPDEDPGELPHPSERAEPFVAVAAGADPGWFIEAKDWRG